MAKKLLELGKSLVSGTKGAIIPFDSAYIYRDYWSSIEGFSKNRFGDYSGMERKKGSRIPHPELKIVRKGNYCQVVTAKDIKDFYKKKLKKGQVVADNLIPFSDVPCNPFIAIPLGVEVKVPVKGKRYDVTELIM